jgi:predicted Zn-dependent protease with MMP-like domain
LPAADKPLLQTGATTVIRPQDRKRFDEILEQVLGELPDAAHRILDEVPLIVEDFPSPEVMNETNAKSRDELCGLHDGIPLTEPEHRQWRSRPEGILIYRAGIMSMATTDDGKISRSELRRQIRITILHEVGHHYGLSEEDLKELGYD